MGLPAKFHDVNWAFMIKNDLAPHFEKYLRVLKLAHRGGIGFFIGGLTSTGKSYSAAVIAKAFRQNELSVQWLDSIEAYDLLIWNREHPDPEYGTWLTRASLVDLLIIDNFGAEKGANKQKILFDVVKRRSDNKLPTVLTTRLNLAGTAELYSDSVDFIKDSMKLVALQKKIESESQAMIKDTF
jgi:DNA replication protein DnaC